MGFYSNIITSFLKEMGQVADSNLDEDICRSLCRDFSSRIEKGLFIREDVAARSNRPNMESPTRRWATRIDKSYVLKVDNVYINEPHNRDFIVCINGVIKNNFMKPSKDLNTLDPAEAERASIALTHMLTIEERGENLNTDDLNDLLPRTLSLRVGKPFFCLSTSKLDLYGAMKCKFPALNEDDNYYVQTRHMYMALCVLKWFDNNYIYCDEETKVMWMGNKLLCVGFKMV